MTAFATTAEPAADAFGAAAAGLNPTQRRWQIIQLQLRTGDEPCFGTDMRYTCVKRDACPARVECLALRAHWRR